MDSSPSAPASSLTGPCNRQPPPVVFRRMPSSHQSVKDVATNACDGDGEVPVSVALSVIEEDNEYNTSASPSLAYGNANSIISFVNEALARASRLADVPSVAAWMANRMADEAGDDELAMKVEAYLSHVCLREYRKTRSESKYIQATSLFGSLFNLGAISSMYLLSVAETLVFTIDFPMRLQGVVVLFASAGSRLCRAEDVARSNHVAVKFGEASNARPRNELLKRYSTEIKSLVDEWTKVEEYKALWG